MIEGKTYTVCDKCEIRHFENCETCFGFGVYQSDNLFGENPPVSAHEAHSKNFVREALPCPECYSTANGLPEGLE